MLPGEEVTRCHCRDHVRSSREHHLCYPSAEDRQRALRQVLELPAPEVAILGAQNHKGRENHKGRDPCVNSSRDEDSGQMPLPPSGKHVQMLFHMSACSAVYMPNSYTRDYSVPVLCPLQVPV